MPKPPDWVQRGDPITESWGNGLVDFIRMLATVVGPGLRLDRSSRRATLSVDLPALAGSSDVFLVSGASGIAARGSATMRAVAGEPTRTGINPWYTAVPADRLCLCRPAGGNNYTVLVWDCVDVPEP